MARGGADINSRLRPRRGFGVSHHLATPQRRRLGRGHRWQLVHDRPETGVGFGLDISGLERDEERRRIARTTEILADLTGRKPAGWFSLPRQGDRYAVGAISPKTIDLLLEAGYVYLGNGLADDIPHYWVSDFASRRALLTMPYYYHFDDQFFLMFPRKGMGLGKRSVRSACR